MYPHTTGVLRNDDPWHHSWVEFLAGAGYRCVNVGKMHTYPYETPAGFHERHVVENKDRSNPKLPFFLDQWDKAFFARGLVKPDRRTKYRPLPDYSEQLGAFV
jgi:arylsulfatase